MQNTISEADTDFALNEMCSEIAKDFLAKASSSDRVPGEMSELIFAAMQVEERKLARIGKVGHWCFFCADNDATKFTFCHCKFPTDLRCHGKLVCEPCRQAHIVIVEHTEKMLSFPAVSRADSRRATLEMALYRAAKRACNPIDSDDYDHAAHRDLAYHLAQADPFGDSATFRAGVLRAFRVSKFMQYQALAAELKNEENREMERAIRRAIRAGNARVRGERICTKVVADYARKLRSE